VFCNKKDFLVVSFNYLQVLGPIYQNILSPYSELCLSDINVCICIVKRAWRVRVLVLVLIPLIGAHSQDNPSHVDLAVHVSNIHDTGLAIFSEPWKF